MRGDLNRRRDELLDQRDDRDPAQMRAERRLLSKQR